jgi:hypothetical protein
MFVAMLMDERVALLRKQAAELRSVAAQLCEQSKSIRREVQARVRELTRFARSARQARQGRGGSHARDSG